MSIIGVIQEDTRTLDYGSCGQFSELRSCTDPRDILGVCGGIIGLGFSLDYNLGFRQK